jgi:membrane-associated phospholipid phosphatase
MKPKRKNKINKASQIRFALFVLVSFIGGIVSSPAQIKSPISCLDRSIHRSVEEHWHYRTKVDDYIQYAPLVAAYGLGFVGVDSRHGWIDRTFLTGASLLIESAVVHSLKNILDVERPDGSTNNSFPSGHTALSFVGAHLLFKEYKDVSPWIGIAGYATATATGAMRILNRRHWLSDVLAGAGIGILSVEAAYLLLPLFHRVTGLPPELTLAPVVDNRSCSISLSYTF